MFKLSYPQVWEKCTHNAVFHTSVFKNELSGPLSGRFGKLETVVFAVDTSPSSRKDSTPVQRELMWWNVVAGYTELIRPRTETHLEAVKRAAGGSQACCEDTPAPEQRVLQTDQKMFQKGGFVESNMKESERGCSGGNVFWRHVLDMYWKRSADAKMAPREIEWPGAAKPVASSWGQGPRG